MELWFDANGNRLVLTGLSELAEPAEAGDYINDATVTASIYDGATVVTGADDVTLTATGSSGRYEKVFAAGVPALTVGRKYRAVITAVDGSDQLQLDMILRVDRRAAPQTA